MDISHDACINISIWLSACPPPCPGLVVVVVVALCPVFTRRLPCCSATLQLPDRCADTNIGAAWTLGKLEQDRVNLVISQ